VYTLSGGMQCWSGGYHHGTILVCDCFIDYFQFIVFKNYLFFASQL